MVWYNDDINNTLRNTSNKMTGEDYKLLITEDYKLLTTLYQFGTNEVIFITQTNKLDIQKLVTLTNIPVVLFSFIGYLVNSEMIKWIGVSFWGVNLFTFMFIVIRCVIRNEI